MYDKDANTDDEEVCLIKKTKQSSKSDIEAMVKDALTYMKPYINKDDGITDIKVLCSRYENFAIQEQ